MTKILKPLLTGICMLVTAVLIAPNAVQAQEVLRIAAVVNDDVISVLDVENRLRLVLLESGLPNDAQTRRRLVSEVVRQLIDERLRMQEAERAGVRIGQRALDRELEKVAQSNKMTAEQLQNLFQQQNIDPITVRARLEANLAWQGIIRRRLRRLVDVGEDEIDEELERLRQALYKPQKLVREIFLAVENPDQEIEIRQSISRLRRQIEEGADFGALARTFSQSSSAEDGGEMGWVTSDQFQEDINAAIQALKPNELSPPIRSLGGYHLFQVLDERKPSTAEDPMDARLSLSQITIPIDSAAAQDVRAEARRTLLAARETIESCADVETSADEIEGAKTNQIDDVRLGDLSPALRDTLAPLQTAQTTDPLDLGRSMALITVCKRTQDNPNLPSRDEIRNKIGTERLNLVARRYLRDVRRDAFIDIRL